MLKKNNKKIKISRSQKETFIFLKDKERLLFHNFIFSVKGMVKVFFFFHCKMIY